MNTGLTTIQGKRCSRGKTVVLTAILFAACGSEQSAGKPADAAEFPRNETLYVGGFDWSAPSTFNRLAADPNWPVDSVMAVMYEPLFGYDQRTGEMVPILAKGYELIRSGGGAAAIEKTEHVLDGVVEKGELEDEIVIAMDERAVWSDGQSVTAADVAYTYNLDRRYPTARVSTWKYMESVEADKNKVVIKLNLDNYNPLEVLDYMSENSILPKKIWEALERRSGWDEAAGKADFMTLLKFRNDKDPVVSGPYNLYRYSDQKIVLKRRDEYWGNAKHGGVKPAPKYIIHSLYNTNANFTSAMVKGHLDVAAHFMPRIWDKAKSGIRAWSLKEPYHLAGSIPALFMALTKPPFDDRAFRRALAHAVDFAKIKKLALSNYAPDLKPGFILPFGPEAKYYSQEDAARYGYSYNPDEARRILDEAGYKRGAEGALLDKRGEPMRRLSVECPRGWSDWESAVKIVVGSLNAVGIPAEESLVDYAVWEQHLQEGAFDLSMRTSTGELWPSTPLRRFDQAMSAAELKPVGEAVYNNFGRYRDAEFQRMLEELPRIKDEAKKKAAYRRLNIKFMEDVPVLPLMYRPSTFYQFSEVHWTGFPTEENPTAPPQCLMIGNGVVGLWSIRPTGK